MGKRKLFFVLLLALLPFIGWSQTSKQSICRDGQVIVKFKTGHMLTRGKANNNVDAVLQFIGGTKAEQLMPRTSAIPAQVRAYNRYDDRKSEPQDLSGLYVLTFDKSQPVESVIEKLKQLDDVVYAEPNYIRRAFGTATDYTSASFFDKQWYLQAINMPYLWEQPIVNEKRPVIAILDTGVDFYDHPNLKNKARYNNDYGFNGEDDDNNGYADDIYGWDCVYDVASNGQDIHGHGTHCAGIASGNPDNGDGIVGANPDAQLIDIRVLDELGLGDDASEIRGIDYAMTVKADIISMSWGGFYDSEALREALEYASTQCILVAAAGNDSLCITSGHGEYAPVFPAAYPFVLAVQATDEQGELASFSNYDCDGPYQSTSDNNYNYDVRAPGVNMLSSYPTFESLRGVGYKRLDGTSMACPLVAGAISRLMQCGKVTDFNSLRDLLIKTSGQTIDMKAAYDATAETMNATTFQCNINGVMMTFHKTSETTVQVGDGTNSAISTATVGSINVPNDVHGLLVTSVAANAFSSCGQLTGVTLPMYVSAIGNQAFAGCTQMNQLILFSVAAPTCAANAFDETAYSTCHVEIPKGRIETYQADAVWSKFSANLKEPLYTKGEYFTKEVGDYTYTLKVISVKEKKVMLRGVEPLREKVDGIVTVPEFIDSYQITSIGDGGSMGVNNAFAGRQWLKQVILPDCITEFPTYAFYDCPNLETVNYPSSLTLIGNYAFMKCPSFKNGHIPGNVKAIGEAACETVYGETGIEEFILEEGVERLETNVITGCQKLKKIHIPSTVFTMSDGIQDLPSLECIEVAEGNKYYDSRDNCNAIISTREKLLLRGCKNTVVPSDITKLGAVAFSGTRGLVDLIIPKRIEYVGPHTFSNCPDIQHITVEKGNAIYYSPEGSNAIINNRTIFLGCSNTVIPDYVTELMAGSFTSTSIQSVTIPTAMYIGQVTFPQSLSTVVSLSKKPVPINYFAFDIPANEWFEIYDADVSELIYGKATLCVPYGCKKIYQATEGWKRFQNIVELDPVVTGDIDGNGSVNETDRQALIDHLLGKNIESYNPTAADLDGDGRVNMRDVVALTDVLVGRVPKTDDVEAEMNIEEFASVCPGHPSDISLFVNLWSDNDTPIAYYVRYILPDGMTFDESQEELKADVEGVETHYVINGNQIDIVVYSPDKMMQGSGFKLRVNVSEDVPKEGFFNVFQTVVTANGKIRDQCGLKPYIVSDYVFVPGDITGSGMVDVQDATLAVNHILGKESGSYDFSVADMNNDGEVDVFDVTAIINGILSGGGGNRAAARRGMQGKDSSESVLLTADEKGLLFDIDQANRFTSFQFDVEVPQGTSLLGVEWNGKTSHSLQFAKNGENRYTVVALSMSSAPLPVFDGSLVRLRLVGSTNGEVRFDNILFVTPEGKASRLNGGTMNMTTGIQGVSYTQGEQIYDISGRQLNMKREQLSKGVYIINNKKVVIK